MFRPVFAYDPEAPTAKQIKNRWMRQHRYLPLASSEPDVIAEFIAQEIERQERKLRCDVPVCIIHLVRMVLLGRLGYMRQHKRQLLNMTDALKQTKAGFSVSAGIFRCPMPGCFRVGTIEAPRAYDLRRPVVLSVTHAS